MPLKTFACSVCGAKAPRKYLEDGQFEKRMAWLRRHYKRKHPGKFKESIRKGVKARAKARRG